MASPLHSLLADDPAVREAAVLDAPAGRPTWFALRSLLAFDTRAQVRAAAARRLGEAQDLPESTGWLVEALADPFPTVREAVCAALGRHHVAQAREALTRAMRSEPRWWVRREAVRGLVAHDAAEALREATADPVWRVRHAALRALSAKGAGLSEHSSWSEVAASGAAWLRGEEAPPVEPATRPDDGLWNPDPAVTTARVERAGREVAPMRLVPLLADSHRPLRRAAANLLLRLNDLEALSAALSWLRDPRTAHAPETVRALLDELDGPVGQALARIALSSAGNTAAACWALEWIAERAAVPLFPLVAEACHDARADVRAAAVSALAALWIAGQADEDAADVLLAAAADPELEVRSRAVIALVESGAGERVPNGEYSPRARAARVHGARVVGDVAFLHAAAVDPHPFVRASALEALVESGAIIDAERDAAHAHADPWVRASVLEPRSAARALAGDEDPQLRRAALDLLVRESESQAPEFLAAAAQRAACAEDPWLRSRCTSLLDPRDDRSLRALLELSRDPVPMVRAAAVDTIDRRCPELNARLAGLLAGSGLTPTQRLAAWALRVREGTPEVGVELAAAVAASTDPASSEALRGLAAALPAEVVPQGLSLPAAAPKPERVRAVRASQPEWRPELRPLGRTGLQVSPLGLSGAYGLAVPSFDHAFEMGANLFFWEPHYHTLTGFVRGQRRARASMVLVAGTFHASREAIRADVETALRRLRTDHLDVFLAFWARSPERLDGEVAETLEELKREGLVRATGFSTHHRELACQALRSSGPWDVLMLRHSAAHPGLEREVLPLARERGVGVLTFSALCYGRLLRRTPGEPADQVLPTAADCYRYSLMQPGVCATWSAPRWHWELQENLQALVQPTLGEDALRALRAHGAGVHEENRRFNTMVRQAGRTEELAPADLAALEEELSVPLASVEDDGAFTSDRRVRLPRSRLV